MDTIIEWGARLSRYFIALPMAIYGAQHFIYLQFVADFIPAWIPWRVFWAGFTGIALLAAATGIVFRIWDRRAATLLAAMIFLWVLLLHTSRVATQPDSPDEWRGFFQALAMSGFVFVLAGTLRDPEEASGASRNRFIAVLDGLTRWGARGAPIIIAVSMMALGLQHFLWPEVASPKVPLWIPGSTAGNHAGGAVLLLSGFGILFGRTERVAAALLGMMIFLSMLFIHLPVVLASPRFDSDWCKTLIMSGGAFLLAQSRSRENRPMNWTGPRSAAEDLA